MNSTELLTYLIDLIAILLLALGIKGLSKVRSARDANRVAASAMFLAFIAVLLNYIDAITVQSAFWILLGIITGSLFGIITAKKVPMTSMPETVALFNGCGGMSSLLVALGVALFPLNQASVESGVIVQKLSIVVSIFVGSITFSGSIIAMAKLQGWLSTPAWTQSRLRHFFNISFSILSLIPKIVQNFMVIQTLHYIVAI